MKIQLVSGNSPEGFLSLRGAKRFILALVLAQIFMSSIPVSAQTAPIKLTLESETLVPPTSIPRAAANSNLPPLRAPRVIHNFKSPTQQLPAMPAAATAMPSPALSAPLELRPSFTLTSETRLEGSTTLARTEPAPPMPSVASTTRRDWRSLHLQAVELPKVLKQANDQAQKSIGIAWADGMPRNLLTSFDPPPTRQQNAAAASTKTGAAPTDHEALSPVRPRIVRSDMKEVDRLESDERPLLPQTATGPNFVEAQTRMPESAAKLPMAANAKPARKETKGKAKGKAAVIDTALATGTLPVAAASAANAAAQTPAEAATTEAKTPVAEMPPTGEAASATAVLAQDYCTNFANSANDARTAWQMQQMADLDKQLQSRMADLEKRRNEFLQMVAQQEQMRRKAEENIVAIFAKLRPDAGAAQMAVMDEAMAAGILTRLTPRAASLILNEMPPAKAAKLTALMTPKPQADTN